MSNTTLKKYQEDRKLLKDWATYSDENKFRAHKEFTAAVKATIGASAQQVPIITVPFGKNDVTLYENGEVKVNDLQVGVHIQTGIPVGSASANYKVGELVIPCGTMLILGAGGLGKTPLAHLLAGSSGRDYGVIRYGEPLAGYISDEDTAAAELAKAMVGNPSVVVDSVKDVLSEAGGGALKSGLARGSLPLLSRWGSLAASVGTTLFIPVNPSSPDDEVVKLLIEAAKSNSTSVAIPDSSDGTAWSVFSRTGEGLQRVSGNIKIKYAANGVVSLAGEGREQPRSDSTPVAELVVSDQAVATAIRRALAQRSDQDE